MKIGLISDTHGYVDGWRKAVELFGDVEFAIHTGDILSSGPFNPRLESYNPLELAKAINFALFPTIFAKGNCDAEVDTFAIAFPIQNPYAFIYAEGLRIMATHGHLYNEDKLVEMGRRYVLDVIVSGHTHVRGIKVKEGIVFVNPGSAALPKGEDEITSVGIIENRTVRLLSLDDGAELDRIEF
ncbi:MAG: hypothetical protein AUK32_05900 [Candidatus Aquicultor secundus]|uniref:phosphodiesterase n=1 Tax=Candidatus Aquicultor secundus TaxID=1973895 RepID=UPI00091BFAAA|nr:phosphodiesterase [Candidatus Aquicultor secundus]NCO66788.1 phosphodiesterase [Solirubrobacter sp.]OIO86175.1 MAG: hypothetical protein AUK32_05900 [Candidatus Aquicultor secundus]